MSQLKVLDLTTIADGAAVELFQRELTEVALNIADTNTNATGKRQITLTFDFVPDNNREEVKVIVASKSKVVPVRGHSKTIYCGKMDGRPSMLGTDQKQLDIFDPTVAQLTPKPGVVNA